MEIIDKTLELEDMALSLFSLAELVHWKTLKLEDKINSFFKHWACKEAFLKASGKGWFDGEKKMPFNIKWEKENNLLIHELVYPHCFESIPGYTSALYVEGPPLHPFYYTWNPDFLQEKA